MIPFTGTYEERLTVVLYKDPDYGEKIMNFMEKNPEFQKVGHLISLTRYPMCWNLNPHEEFRDEAPS